MSGCTLEVIQGLFERYDPDGSGSLSYDEFIKGVFKLPDAPPSARAAGRDLTNATGTHRTRPTKPTCTHKHRATALPALSHSRPTRPGARGRRR